MRTKIVLLCFCALGGLGVAHADPLNLFTNILYSGSNNSPPPEDSLAVFDSNLDITGVAGMPATIAVNIPRPNGAVSATIQLEHMDRREGFVERDSNACLHGDPSGCEIIPYPGLSADLFSYTWTGQGAGYDLRLTIHHGYAVGVLSGPKGRFEIRRNAVKELRLAYFRTDDSLPPLPRSTGSPSTQSARPVPVMSAAAAQAATLARIEPQTPAGAGTTALDLLILITEEARRQAGGNPSDCHDTAGAMAYVYQNINSINTSFQRSQIPARVGVVTVTGLTGYTLIPDDGTYAHATENRNNIRNSANIRAFRDVVGADVVATVFDTQTHLGPCGVAFLQRPDCGTPGGIPGCGTGAAFSQYAHLLETIQCNTVDTFTHELGHVLGAEHDPDHTSGTPSFPYSYGYGYPALGSGFETIMAQRFYSQPTYYPTRLLQFSNPNLSYNGHPTGTAVHYDNAHTLTNLVPGTAAFRTRPERIFISSFDENNPCPSITY